MSPWRLCESRARRALRAGTKTTSVATSTVAAQSAPVIVAIRLEGTSIRTDDGRVFTILGLDTGALPEGQACHSDVLAGELAKEIPSGTRVSLEPDTADPRGMYLFRASDGVLINEALLYRGAAPARTQGLRLADRLSAAAGDAVRNGRGIWAPCPGATLPGGIELPPVTIPGVPLQPGPAAD